MPNFEKILIVVLFSVFTSCRTQWHQYQQHHFMVNYNYEYSYCQTPLGDQGSCVSLKYCPEILTLFTRLGENKAKQYSMVLQRLCGNRITPDQYPVVCCTQVVTTTTTTTTSNNEHTFLPITEPAPTTTTSTHSTNTADTTSKNDLSRDRLCSIVQSSITGLCKPLQECPSLWDPLKANPDNENLKTDIRNAHNACGNKDTVICCPSDRVNITPNRTDTKPVHQLPAEDEGCGLVRLTTPKIVGGEESQIGAWPWMALLGYDPHSVTPFKCGGSLISSRHVITAAHCIRHDLSFVRLGEFDLTTESETRHLDVNILKHSQHPQYGKNRRSDLALLLLETVVQFTVYADLIAPICMPNSITLRSKSYVDSMPFVAGWGYTQQGGSRSHVLKETQLPVQKNDVCSKIYTKLYNVSPDEYDDSVLCAGYTVGGSDSCQGDSGGPLMIPELYKGITRYYLIGIVSYGHGCGQVPGVYMSTQHQMDWILQQVNSM